MPKRRLPTESYFKREAQVNRIFQDLKKLDILACLSHNATALLTGASTKCDGCDLAYHCRLFRKAIRDIKLSGHYPVLDQKAEAPKKKEEQTP